MRESDRYIRLKQLRETALPFVTQLLPMGITAADVDLLNTDTSDLVKATPVIKVKKAKVSQSTAELKQTVKAIKLMLKDGLDALMLEFKYLNPTLYGEYLNARKVNDQAAGHAPKQDPPEA